MCKFLNYIAFNITKYKHIHIFKYDKIILITYCKAKRKQEKMLKINVFRMLNMIFIFLRRISKLPFRCQNIRDESFYK